ncbi:MAG: class I adenylate-forming enzyme family protein [Sandaracinaceae bacterium]
MSAGLLARHAPADAVAWDDRGEVTAGELRADVGALASALAPGAGDAEVVVVCQDRYRFAVALFAAWRRGLRVALTPSAEAEAIREVRQRPGVLTVLHDVDGTERGLDVRAALAAGRGAAGPAPLVPPPGVAVTLFTSGSTGAPAACPKTGDQLLGEAQLLVDHFGLARGGRVLPLVPPHHIYGLLFGVLRPLLAGAAFHRRTPLAPDRIARAMGSAGGTELTLVAVPVHLRALAGAPPEAFGAGVDRVFSSAAPLPPHVASAVRERLGWTVTEVFGSTETGGIAWRDSGGRGPWRPLPGIAVRADEDGALLLDSPFLPPEAPRPYRSADRIQLGEGGTFVHLGRSDGVVKVGGFRVALAEVEERLGSVPGVEDVAALAVEVEGARGQEIWVVAVAPALRPADLRASLKGVLPAVARPRRIRLVPALPRGPRGKARREDLMALFQDRGAEG